MHFIAIAVLVIALIVWAISTLSGDRPRGNFPRDRRGNKYYDHFAKSLSDPPDHTD